MAIVDQMIKFFLGSSQFYFCAKQKKLGYKLWQLKARDQKILIA
jgi:hypothetical protein